jgi:ABC-type sugar transport system substrate-binding protein
MFAPPGQEEHVEKQGHAPHVGAGRGGGGNAGAGDQGRGGGGGGENGGPFTIGVSNGFVSSEWRTQMISEMERVNDEYKGEGLTEDLVIESADVDVQGQIQQMRNLINRGVDAIIINPNDISALNQVRAGRCPRGCKTPSTPTLWGFRSFCGSPSW